jgi:hypothetical protein
MRENSEPADTRGGVRPTGREIVESRGARICLAGVAVAVGKRDLARVHLARTQVLASRTVASGSSP